ncbi:LicD family protein [Sporofaciens musculi]|nr:LicD family protein [Sporofaciens musculi]
MRKVTELRELQLIETNIFKEFLMFCKKHSLKVNVLGGTLIGAVRHKGFIPWDDDIDVSMSRPDYEKLVRLQKKGEAISEHCYLMAAETDDSFNGYIPQVVYRESRMLSGQYREKEELKIGISIFVYDGTPRSSLIRKIYFKKMFLLRSMHALCRADFEHVNTGMAKKIGPIIQPFFKSKNTKKYRNKVLKAAKKYPYMDSKFVAPNADTAAYKEVVKKSVYEQSKELEFEGFQCFAASNYIEHLKKYYGDYMQFPPEEVRVAKHSFDAWIEKSYQAHI